MAINYPLLWGLRPVVREFVANTLTNIAERHIVGVITVPVPFIPLSVFLGTIPREMSFVWNSPPSGISCVGGGVAHRIEVNGHERFGQLRERSESLWARVVAVRHPNAPHYTPRLYGGLAFSPRDRRKLPWLEFGDGTFTLPRWIYGHQENGGFLSLAVCFNRERRPLWQERILNELDEVLDVLFASQGPEQFTRPRPTAKITSSNLRQLPITEWKDCVQNIRQEIADGQFHKIVAARRCEVQLPFRLSDIDVLGRLFAEPKCTHFAFRRAHSTFLGASPELLFLKSDLDLRTQALAGTLRTEDSGVLSHSGEAKRLLKSQKDRSEQGFVVAAIRESLAPLCTEVTIENEPEVLDLPNILHINTPFRAILRPTTHATEVLDALHPTPAVGGVPRKAAQEWIVENETEERGWYTGPVGWLDSQGNAEFVVSIRCGVLTGNRAFLFTGAGVVINSEYTAEYEETALKQLPMLRALGMELE